MHAIRVVVEDHARIGALLDELSRSDGDSWARSLERLERELIVHTVAARQSQSVDTSTSHVGFRCVVRPG